MRECIGCGCTDTDACQGERGRACHWVHVQGTVGICSSCVEAFDDPVARLTEAAAGAAPRWCADDEEDEDGSSLILPGDPEFVETLRGEE
jgi:hypothetical protein